MISHTIVNTDFLLIGKLLDNTHYTNNLLLLLTSIYTWYLITLITKLREESEKL
jgi:hypothetical protein